MKGEQLSSNGEALSGREPLPNEILVRPWADELVEARGFGPRSMYVEMCWLPILGPTATWLYRRLGSWAEFNPEGLAVDLTDLSVSLGLGEGLGHSSHLGKGLDRLTYFGAARWMSNQLQVRRALAPLPERHVRRLSYSASRIHEESTRRPQPSKET
jgi:hypothetical protein